MELPASSLELFSLAGQVAIVTGGSKGLGHALAEALSGAGARVAITSRHLEEGRKAAAEIEDLTGRQVLALEADASRRDEVEASVADTLDAFGRIDILVNNAGVNLRRPIIELADEEWEAVLGANLHGPMYYCRAVGAHMVANRYGRVINVASTLSLVSLPERSPYASSKGGLLQLTKTLALEWAPYGITVNAICPGPFATAINQVLLDDPEAAETMRSRVPLGRWGEPAELATAVLCFASKASSFTTGATLMVDGAYTAV